MTQNDIGNVRNQVHTTTGENDRLIVEKLIFAKEKLIVAKEKLDVAREKLVDVHKKLAVANKGKLPLDVDIQPEKLAVSIRRAYGRELYPNDFQIPIRKTTEESKKVQTPYLDCDRDFSHLSKSAQDILKNYKAEYVEDMEWVIVNLDGEVG